MKALKKALMALLGAALGCCMFVGCLSTTIEVEYVVDGEVYRVQDYEMNEKISLPTPPTKEGHTFIGWYTDEALTTPYTEGEITVGLTLYAKFSVSTVYIVVNTDGGEEIAPISVTPGGDYTVPDAVKEGHTFVGYTYIDENLTEQPFPSSGKFPGSNSIRITAHYEVNKYDVTFVDDGDTDVEVEHGKKVTAPATGKTGYTFDGWYTSATEQTDATKFDFNTAITGAITLYAKYTANSYTVSINENGGSFANAADKSVTVSYDGTYTLATPTREGYTFTGYTVDGDEFPTSGTYTRDGNVRIVANWTINKYTVTLKDFDTDAVLSTQENVAHGTYATAPNAEAGYDKTLYKEDKTTVMNVKTEAIVENTVIYVKKEAKTFTITVNGVPGTYVNPTVKYQGTYTLDTASLAGITGWDFVGFEKDGVDFPATGTYTWTENITVTAKWNTIYAPIYFYDGATVLNALSILDKQEGADLADITLPAVPDKTGYSNDGKWYTDAACTTEFVKEGTLPTEGLKLYAKYTAKPYKITVLNNVDSTERTVDVLYNEVPDFGTPSKTGYKFVKYTYENAEFDEDAAYTYAHNITVREVWEEVPQYVKFMDGVNELNEVKVLNGLTVSKPADPTKTGYTFAGWYTTSACTQSYDFATPVTEDIEVYAKWTANTYTVIFSVWDSATKTMKNVEVTATYDQPLTAVVPTPADRSAYELLGYTVNGEAFDVTKPFTSTETIIIAENWELKEGEDLFHYAGEDEEGKELLYFQERATYDDPWTYVYLVGEEYTFAAGAELQLGAGADAYASVNSNVLTIKAVGAFTLTVNGAARTAKAVEYVQSFDIGGTGYDSAWGIAEDGEYKRYAKDKLTEALGDDVWNKRVAVAEGEAMKVGRVNFIPEININGLATTIDKADVVISVSCDGATTDKYTVANGAITFDASLIGKKVSVTVQPKYAVDATHVVTYDVLVNAGVNVYTNDELKAAYANKSISEINILRNIKVELSADQVNTFTVDGKTYTSPKNGSSENGGTGVYERWTGNLTLNGNYFNIDGTAIPIIDGRDGQSADYPSGTREPNYTSEEYALQNVQFSIFSFGKRKADHYDALTIENLNIIGNQDRNTNSIADYTLDGHKVLINSGACIGIQVGSGTLNLNNVTVRYGTFGVNSYGGDPILKKDSTTEYTYRCFVNAVDCNFSENWANNIYAQGFSNITLDSCYLGVSSGAAIHFDTKACSIAINSALNLINDTLVENWVTGSEAWFTAYNAGVAVTGIKAQLDQGVQYVSGSKRTVVKVDAVTGTETVNFVLLVRQNGDDWSEDDGISTIILNVGAFDGATNLNTNEKYARFAADGETAGKLGFTGLDGMVEIIDK